MDPDAMAAQKNAATEDHVRRFAGQHADLRRVRAQRGQGPGLSPEI